MLFFLPVTVQVDTMHQETHALSAQILFAMFAILQELVLHASPTPEQPQPVHVQMDTIKPILLVLHVLGIFAKSVMRQESALYVSKTQEQLLRVPA
jgi:hypothetical protein